MTNGERRAWTRGGLLVALTALTLPACARIETFAAEREALALWSSRCASCHGATGHGDGLGGAALAVRPRDFTSVDWQSKVSDTELHDAIVQGGAGVGKSPMMPGNPDLTGKPRVVDALLRKVRSFAR
jgi:mono/diheme cytochrome c family protein